MEFPWPARPVILAILLLSLAAHSHTQTTYDEFLDKIESVLNGSTPVGKVDSILFTQANRYNLARSNKARAKSASQGGGKSVSHRSPFRSNSLRSSVASDPGVDSSSGNTGGSASGSSGSSFGLISRFFTSFFSVRSSATTSGFTKPAPPLSTFQNGVKWLSSSAAASKSNRAKLNFLLKLLGQPSLNEALGNKKSAFFIPADANVTLEAEGVTNLTAAQATVPNTVPTTPAPVSGQSYGQNYAMMSSGTVGVLHDDDDDERRSRGGRQYRIECHDDEEDDDEEECIEPVGKVRIIKYTSPENISYVLLRAKSECLPDVRKVQIRNAPYGKTGSLVLEIPGSWRLVDDDEIELVKHTFIANASSVIVANGQTLEKAVISMTKAPWNYYAIFTTGSKKNGAIRGQLWKPFCPWCGNFTFTGT